MNTSWHYQTPICTGLGDRLGIVFSLSALASLHGDNTTVWMEWCTDPRRVVLTNERFLQYIPRWTGWEYPLDQMQSFLKMPENVRFYLTDQRPPTAKPVTVGHDLPSVNGITQASTLYWRALRLSEDKVWSPSQYVQAYKSVPLKPVNDAPFSYVLIHFRGRDHNTHDRDETHFCTRQVVAMLRTKTRAHLRMIANNVSQALKWLHGLPSIEIVHHGTNAFAAMQLALNSAAIVQHASEGWSAFTSVPAMAKSIPLINTFHGHEHRHAFFAHHGGLPAEFHACKDIPRFVHSVAHLGKD
jgi:hypothetical protein